MGSPLVLDVSRAILELTEEEKLARIENKWFGDQAGACVSKRNSTDSSSLLELRSFSGLFLTNAVVSVLALLIHLATFVCQEREHAEPAGAGRTMSLPWLRAWLRRFDTFKGRRGESVRNGSGAEELAAGDRDQEVAMREFTSVDTSMEASDSGRNAASGPVSEEILAPESSSGLR